MADALISLLDPVSSLDGTEVTPVDKLISGVRLTQRTTTQDIANLGGSLGLLKANNLSDLANAGTARTNLGVAIGTNVQAFNASLAAIAAGTYIGAASFTTLGTIVTGIWNGTTIAVANGGTGSTTASAARTALGLAIGTDVQAFDAQLSSLIRQNSHSADYTLVLSDGGRHQLHPAADTTARTFTIDSNANVPWPIGTAHTFVNEHGAGVLTIAITSDTMRLAGAGTTGSRTLAADGIATALKITTTSWNISGTGLT